MRRKISFVLLSALILSQVFGFGLWIKPEKAKAVTIQIGDADCGTTLSTAGAIYELTENMTCAGAGLIIGANGITLDGKHNTLTGPGVGAVIGIDAANRGNITIKDFDGINSFQRAINAGRMANTALLHSRIENNIFSGNYGQAAMYLYYSKYIDIVGNTITNNTVTNGAIYIFGENAGSLTTDFTITGNSISSNAGVTAIGLATYTSGNTISGNTIISNSVAILLSGSVNNTITDNTMSSNPGGGIMLAASANNNTFSKNTSDLNGYGVSLNASTGNTFTNSVFNNSMNMVAITAGSTATFNNCTFNRTRNNAILFTGVTGGTVTFHNSIITIDTGTVTFEFDASEGTVNTDHSMIQTAYNSSSVFTSGTGTWNEVAADGTWHGADSDIKNPFPYYAQTKENMGFMTISNDDAANIGYFKTIADYAKTNYGMQLTTYINSTNTLTDQNKADLLALHNQGHEIGTHTRHHALMSELNAFDITYSGSNAQMALTVSALGTSLTVDGTSDHTDKHGPIDITSTSYDTINELCSAIENWDNFSCSKKINGAFNTGSSLSKSIKDTSIALTIGVAKNVPYDDDLGAGNRFFSEEITGSIDDLEAIIGEGNVKTLAWPGNVTSASAITWIKNNAPSLIAIRGNNTFSKSVDLANFDPFAATEYFSAETIKGADYDPLSPADKQERIRSGARMIAAKMSNGNFFGTATHYDVNFTLEEYGWYLDELNKYSSYITVGTMADNIEYITDPAHGWNCGADGGRTSGCTRTFSDTDNLKLRNNSPAINAGVAIGGRTTDVLGNALVGTPDIGAYEFRGPTNPSSLTQFKTDGTTAISSGGWTNQSSAVLKFTASSLNTHDSFTPSVEVETVGTDFSNEATHTGALVSFAGSDVTGSVLATGLTDGSYHWQALSTNSAIASSWIQSGGDPDFKVDITAPTLTVSSPANNYSTTASSVIITGGATDALSGIANDLITINGTSISNPASFSATASLNVGANTISVVATDIAGNSTTRTLTITRTLPVVAVASAADSTGSSAVARASSALSSTSITDNTDPTTFYSAIIDNNNNNGQTTLEPTTTPTFYSQYPKLKGKTYANSTVIIEIHSDPITAEVTSDAEGYWEYTPTQALDFGAHTIKITVKEQGTSNILSTDEYKFNIVEKAKAQSTETVAPESQTNEKQDAWPFWILGVVLVIIFVSVGYKVSKRS